MIVSNIFVEFRIFLRQCGKRAEVGFFVDTGNGEEFVKIGSIEFINGVQSSYIARIEEKYDSLNSKKEFSTLDQAIEFIARKYSKKS
jgi:hypothetical protein